MKLLLGVLLLLVAFVAAALWQRSWRAEAEAERGLARSGERGPDSKTAEEQDEAWGRVIIGRPSGASPEPPALDAPARREVIGAPPAGKHSASAADAGVRPKAQDQHPTASSSSSESKIVVKSGESLSSLCQAHYGTSRLDVVQALALYNNLKDPNQLREGQSLSLPPIESLLNRNRR